MKENVILGKLIPAGTGMRHYRRIELEGKAYESPYDQVVDAISGEFAEDGEGGQPVAVEPIEKKKDDRPVFI